MKQRWLCLALALVLCLSGCGGQGTSLNQPEGQQTTDQRQTAQNDPSGFGLAYVAEYGLNPYTCTCLTNRPILSLVCEGLFALNGSYEAQPVLCDSFAVSENGQTYLFTLCANAVFSDGSALTADDVVASLQAAKDSEYYGGRFTYVAEISAKDSATVVISLTTAYENLPLLLDVPIVKKDCVKKDIPIGTGPYVLGQAEDGAVTLTKNNAWWQQGPWPVEQEQITITLAEDPTQVRDSFEFGATTLVCADLNAPGAVGYRCDYELWNGSTTIMQYVGFNLTGGVFSNKELRAAFTHALDREEIVSKIYAGFAQPACLPCSPDSPWYDDALAETYGYDKQAFRQAADEIQTGVGVTILVCSDDAKRVELANYIANTLTPYGFTVKVNGVDEDHYAAYLSRGEFDLYIGQARLPGNFDLSSFFRVYGALAYGGLQNDDLYGLCLKALENSGNLNQLYQAVMDGGYICPVLFKSWAIMATRGTVEDLTPGVDNVFYVNIERTLADASVAYDQLTGEEIQEGQEEEGQGGQSPEEEENGRQNTASDQEQPEQTPPDGEEE